MIDNGELALGLAIGSSSMVALVMLIYVISSRRSVALRTDPDLSVFDEAISPQVTKKRSPSSAVKKALSNLSFKTPPRTKSKHLRHGHAKRPSGRSFWSIDVSNPADADSVDPDELDDIGSPSSFRTGLHSASTSLSVTSSKRHHSKHSSLSSSSTISSKGSGDWGPTIEEGNESPTIDEGNENENENENAIV
ncbi:hypothetical protein TrLO_g10561 [Triparma laevis f. longispina]|uniref:Uncharacterized protein n=1 Tax=Triparma laevis f. longispina TaxID=1714387 RepID=A0A9W7FTA0_9STRA|nr:hypothetical protein TrLO_g10561 [Triparma laevis f. longispina]